MESSNNEKVYRFAIVPKETINPFYSQVLEGCEEMAALLPQAECVYTGPASVDAAEQAAIIRDLIITNSVDGISMAVIDEGIASELAQEAYDANIPFITFDSDAPDSKRLMYVGTDNFEFGQSLAKVLLQLSPKGGTYGIVDASPPNVALRSKGVRHRLLNTRWTEASTSPQDCQDSIALSLDHMRNYASQGDVQAIIPVGGWPMRDTINWKLFVDANRNITLNVGDTDPNQLNLLSKTYVDGLVGQVPYQMGTESIKLLLELASGKKQVPTQELFTTSLVEVIRIPLSLPRVVVDDNQINNLKYIGIIGATIVFAFGLSCILFTGLNRKKRVVKASQPLFLYMICVGVMLMASSLIPVSVDDSWRGYTKHSGVVACMSVPWALFLGFTTTFSALFAKQWRVNKIFRTTQRFARKEVSEKDVILPFVSLLLGNVLVLSVWTALSPMEYTRQPHEGTDDWNRVISTYGSCHSDGALPYWIVLGVMNFALLVIANVQAYRARSIQSEFSESRYIGIVMASMLQTCLIGVPIAFLVNDNPQARYIVVTFMIFLNCMAVLLLIFIPKVTAVQRYSRNVLEAQLSERRRMAAAVPKNSFFEGPRNGRGCLNSRVSTISGIEIPRVASNDDMLTNSSSRDRAGVFSQMDYSNASLHSSSGRQLSVDDSAKKKNGIAIEEEEHEEEGYEEQEDEPIDTSTRKEYTQGLEF